MIKYKIYHTIDNNNKIIIKIINLINIIIFKIIKKKRIKTDFQKNEVVV